MNRIILAILLLSSQILPTSAESTPKNLDKPREYHISEATRSIVFGRSCQMTIDGNSAQFIRRTAADLILSYQENIRRKDARVLATVIVNSAIKKCSLTTLN
jgi:hypothetical protein